MSLPPLNPDKTASGIIVDPRTLERVVPQSKRKDGSVRKEQKIRPGFTPQEDVGRFRSSRAQAADATKPSVPGSNRPAPPKAAGSSENPFAQEQRDKTKAQLKNEKRREKRREKVAVNWDEDDDEDDGQGQGDGGMSEAFKAADNARGAGAGAGAGVGAEQNFPPFSGDGGVPEESVLDDIKKNDREDRGTTTTAALEPAPPAASTVTKGDTDLNGTDVTSGGATATSASSPATTDDMPGKPSLLADRKAETKAPAKPHPIQGGRKGPLGLAHPPPVEETPEQPSRADADTWRKVTPRGQGQGRGQGRGRGGKPPGAGRNQRNGGGQGANGKPTSTPGSASAPAPRERKEVRVREGGTNDVSSLASRVKNLVLANTVGNGSGKEKKQAEGETK